MKEGYSKEVLEEAISNPKEPRRIVYLLPHFAVCSVKRYHVVWDGAAKHKGLCLNYFLNCDRQFINLLLNTLLHFHQGKYGIASDMKSMFIQIKMAPQDRDAIRFLLYENNNLDDESKNTVSFPLSGVSIVFLDKRVLP